MKNERLSTYVALEELNFVWSKKEVKDFEYLWKKGHSIEDISNYFDRDIDEVALLVMDRARKNKVKPRGSGVMATAH
jgi:hypothetical protein